MNLLKAQDLELKIKSVDSSLHMELVKNKKNGQQELVIKSQQLNRYSLPLLINHAGENAYVIEADNQFEGFINFIIF